jgi:hypothetical protein
MVGKVRFSTNARRMISCAGMVAALALAMPAQAQNDKMTPIPVPAQPTAIDLATGPLPGATAPEAWHSQYGSVFARNVTVATLTPFLPDPAKATGTAVIVAPGGGFRTLSMENEGWTPQEMPAFEQSMREMFSGVAQRPRMDPQQAIAGLTPQINDARAAFALVRKRAKEWHIDRDRVGMVGFSAGAMLTLATTLAGDDAKPAFIGLIYGPLTSVTVPADAPPMFVALAADDPFFNGGFGLMIVARQPHRSGRSAGTPRPRKSRIAPVSIWPTTPRWIACQGVCEAG